MSSKNTKKREQSRSAKSVERRAKAIGWFSWTRERERERERESERDELWEGERRLRGQQWRAGRGRRGWSERERDRGERKRKRERRGEREGARESKRRRKRGRESERMRERGRESEREWEREAALPPRVLGSIPVQFPAHVRIDLPSLAPGAHPCHTEPPPPPLTPSLTPLPPPPTTLSFFGIPTIVQTPRLSRRSLSKVCLELLLVTSAPDIRPTPL